MHILEKVKIGDLTIQKLGKTLTAENRKKREKNKRENITQAK